MSTRYSIHFYMSIVHEIFDKQLWKLSVVLHDIEVDNNIYDIKVHCVINFKKNNTPTSVVVVWNKYIYIFDVIWIKFERNLLS